MVFSGFGHQEMKWFKLQTNGWNIEIEVGEQNGPNKKFWAGD
jgi:hypothetical protein